MEYTNVNFEKFQELLETGIGRSHLLWELRDSIFCEAFYGRKQKLLLLCKLPLGQYLMLLVEWFRSLRQSKNIPLIECRAPVQFLFCSARNNHINRLYPLFKEILAEQEVSAWVSDGLVFDKIDETHHTMFQSIEGRWATELKFNHFSAANKLCFELDAAVPNFFTRTDLRKIHTFLVMFHAWKEVWAKVFHHEMREVYCTFEKSPIVKAFFAAAKECGIPKRVHWIHGLRHSSIQSTYATELWCMTGGDVRFFKTRVPKYCTPIEKRNPETDLMVAAVGIKRPAKYKGAEPVHFLFLGPGLESSYTDEMRKKDMAVIQQAQSGLGNFVEWRFRPHPSAVDRFRDELKEAGVSADDFSSNSLEEDLVWSDAVGSSWSSLLLDIRETGRPIYWIQDEVRSVGGVDELIADGVGIHASRDNFIESLSNIFHLEREL